MNTPDVSPTPEATQAQPPKTAAKKVAAKKGSAQKPAAKQPAAKAPAVKKAAAPKAVSAKAAPAAKPAKPVKAAKPVKPVKAPKATKPVKLKIVRDSFTMPEADFALIEQIKQRALGWKQPAKKSEVLRAALQALQALPDAKVRQLLSGLTPIKKGRPQKPS
ncbi:hypothetical protein EYS42_15550 [Aquabacterium lacunae]|uniref:Histone n=1 Tax=Aquabacterium lacunae TaxID=2528630 RepID=A0A4Q9GZI7_9BURK|nr:hypothetical protein [Aquabacterium lacunae]TBO28416.1 hypothetical protein EYS42_15550 [Aquabacterium lacunae]